MKNKEKTKEQLINELVELRQRIAELENKEDFTKFREAVHELGLYWLVLNEPPPAGD